MTIDPGVGGSWWEKAKPNPQSSTCRYRVTPRSPTFAQDDDYAGNPESLSYGYRRIGTPIGRSADNSDCTSCSGQRWTIGIGEVPEANGITAKVVRSEPKHVRTKQKASYSGDGCNVNLKFFFRKGARRIRQAEAGPGYARSEYGLGMWD